MCVMPSTTEQAAAMLRRWQETHAARLPPTKVERLNIEMRTRIERRAQKVSTKQYLDRAAKRP